MARTEGGGAPSPAAIAGERPSARSCACHAALAHTDAPMRTWRPLRLPRYPARRETAESLP